MIPLYLTMKSFGWINTYQGIAAPYLIMSFGIFLMRQHIAHGIPDELLDAARVDGASELRIFFRVIVPLCVVGASAPSASSPSSRRGRRSSGRC